MALQRPELLAPAGDWECVKAAVENGADAVYFGLEKFNARMRAQNFTVGDLPELLQFLHRRGVKGYVTLNTLIFPQELPQAEAYLRTMIAAGVDAVIVQDIGLCRLIRHLSPDFPIHGSTQMTITSAAGVEFAHDLGCQLVVLARECSLKEINKIQSQITDQQISMPLEVFVHGALCVAYSGQCLTSEALGGRSANRGECAQACRMPYELFADGTKVDLGQRSYLLSPQDLSGLAVLPELVKSGVTCLKIEGRLKSPEYVANVTRVYREALDQVCGARDNIETTFQIAPEAQYNLEMGFSRGLYTGWFEGIDNQTLVHGQFAKKRGVYLGTVSRINGDRVLIEAVNSALIGAKQSVAQNSMNQGIATLKAGDGVVFDHGAGQEFGGRIYKVESQGKEIALTFARHGFDLRNLVQGMPVWKTSDPELEKQWRQTYGGEHPKFTRPIQLTVYGAVDTPLTVIASDELGHTVQVDSQIPLVAATKQPLTTEKLTAQLGRLGNTPFHLATLENHLEGELMLPVSELNQVRRQMVMELEQLRAMPKRWTLHSSHSHQELLPDLTQSSKSTQSIGRNIPELIVLVRNIDQLNAAISAEVNTIYCELEDPRRYREMVVNFRQKSRHGQTIWLAPPRICKSGEYWILDQVLRSEPDGYLVRNYDQLKYFADQKCVADFSLNIANALTAKYFKEQYNLVRLTASYDLNVAQVEDLLVSCPQDWLEITIHQHMPMFHMEHCVFCAFLSIGKDFTDCGRPCEKHEVTLRDRSGVSHILQADAGCRNTLFNGTAQTGAEHIQKLQKKGVKYLRLEFLNESAALVAQTIGAYQQLLRGELTGTQLWQSLKLHNRLGVTRGNL
ncbi:MAG: DUF3656 domain-containing protein [Pseudanabaenaceae cyanobacterium]